MTWPFDLTLPAGAFLLTAVAGIACLAGAVQSALGFGYGIVALAILPLVLDARQSHLVVSVSGIAPLAAAACVYRRRVFDLPYLAAITAACAFLPLGLLAFKSMPLDWLVRATGIVILIAAAGELLPGRRVETQTVSRWTGLAAGSVSGFLAGAVSVSGPPLAAFALRQNWPVDYYRSFVTSFLLIISSAKSAGLLYDGLLTKPVLQLSFWAVPFALAGVVIGVVVGRKLHPQRFRALVALGLVIAASSLIYHGAETRAVNSTPPASQ